MTEVLVSSFLLSFQPIVLLLSMLLPENYQNPNPNPNASISLGGHTGLIIFLLAVITGYCCPRTAQRLPAVTDRIDNFLVVAVDDRTINGLSVLTKSINWLTPLCKVNAGEKVVTFFMLLMIKMSLNSLSYFDVAKTNLLHCALFCMQRNLVITTAFVP